MAIQSLVFKTDSFAIDLRFCLALLTFVISDRWLQAIANQ